MTKVVLIICSVVFPLLVACSGSRGEHARRLSRADSLLPVRPDSAWQVLQEVSLADLRDEGEQAWYALLQTEAAVRGGHSLSGDSLIRVAVDYYDRKGDVEMQARAHYWAGNAYRRLEEEEQALREYWRAEELAREEGDMRLLGAIYNNWAYLYGVQGLYERSDSLYQLVGRIGELLPDSVLWAESLCRRANIYINQGVEQYASAEKLLKLAQEMGMKKRNKQLQRIALNLLTVLYARMDYDGKALESAKQYLALQEDTSQVYAAYRMLGFAYYWNRQYDSASYYLRKALPIKGYKVKISIYQCLATIARREGQDELAQRMEAAASSYKDSLIVDKTSLSLVETEKNMALSQHEQQQASRLFVYGAWALLWGSFMLGGVIFIFYLRRRRWRQEKAYWDKEKAESIQKQCWMQEQLKGVEELLHQSQTHLEEKEEQVADLQQKLGQQLEVLHRDRTALLQEELEYQPVYMKMKKIMQEYAQHEKSNEEMTEEDWVQWEDVANRRWNQICLKLRGYGLTNVEIRLCSLLLTDVPVTRMACLFARQRNFCYTTQQRIWNKKLKPYFETCSKLDEVLKYLINTPLKG